MTVGALSSSTADPVAGPRSMVIERDMSIPADGLRLCLYERSDIAPGDDVAIELGHDGDETTAFTGTVVAARPAISGVEIRAVGKMNALLNLRTVATFEGQAIGGIARDLIDSAGLSAGTVDDGPTLPRYAVDTRASAYAHLKNLADSLGYELYADRDGNVMFHALGDAGGLDASIGVGAALGQVLGGGEAYAFGQNLIRAAASRQEPALDGVVVGGESPMSGEGDTTAHWLTANDADYRGSAGGGERLRVVHDPAARTKDLADRFAAGRLSVAGRRAHETEITVMGRPEVDLGETLTTEGLGDGAMNASGYVRAIRHRFGENSGFTTTFRICVGGEG